MDIYTIILRDKIHSLSSAPSSPLTLENAPRHLFTSVSPSAEIVEGDSVTLTCSSDANPAAKYTWYKENHTIFQGPEGNYYFKSFSFEDRGIYYCKTENQYGWIMSSSLSVDVQYRSSSGAGKLVAAGTITVVLLAVILLAVFLWIRKKRASRDSSEPGERADNREQRQPEEQGDLQYASIHFSNQADPLYSNMRPAQPLRHTEQREDVEYVTVKFNSARTAPRTRGRGGGEDPAALYSTVNKSR
ncbi:B-cell receptor CD22-like [Epinephelus lanceolatus]